MPPVRIEEIIQRLRRELAEGDASTSPVSRVETESLPAISAQSELEYLNRNWQLFDPLSEMRSHRRWLGPMVLRLKWRFRRLVLGVLDRYFEKERLFLLELVRLQNALAARSDRLLREITERTKAVAERNDLFLGGLDLRVEALEARDQMRRESAGDSPVATQGVGEDEEGVAEMANAFSAGMGDRLRQSADRLCGAGRVLVLGCGDGAAIATLRELGVDAAGVDSSDALVAACRARGFAAERASLVGHLQESAEESLGGVVVTRIGDRHPRSTWPRLIAAAWRALRPNGLAVFEGMSAADRERVRWLLARQRFTIVEVHEVSGPFESEPESVILAARSAAG